MKNTSIATLQTDFKGTIHKWVELTYPFHKLAPGQMDTISELLYHYFLLKEKIKDEEVLWKMVFDYDTKLKIKESLKIKDYTLQNSLTKLRKKGIINDGKIMKAYIPNIEIGAKNFKIVFNFIVSDK